MKLLTPKDKEEALKLLELDIIEMQEVSKRWSADMSSDSWLSKERKTNDVDLSYHLNLVLNSYG